ncbi:MAG: heavy-metal-associated domain-containing protein [bacterium]
MHACKNISRVSWAVFLLVMAQAFSQEGSYAQDSRPVAKAAVESNLMEVTFQVHVKDNNAILEKVQNALLPGVEGVRYVGADYKSLKVVVRYDSSKVDLKKIQSALNKIAKGAFSPIADPKKVKPEGWTQAENTSGGFANTRFECLKHGDARALCETHFQNKLPEGVDLEDCYTIKVDFHTMAHIDSNYDWKTQAHLVDDNGNLIMPLSWLELPAESLDAKTPGSGLLIFPKIPLTKLGLTLRLLRANGTGYDSFAIDVPKQ